MLPIISHEVQQATRVGRVYHVVLLRTCKLLDLLKNANGRPLSAGRLRVGMGLAVHSQKTPVVLRHAAARNKECQLHRKAS